jgi:SAM-dependent methyltransferase
MLMSLAEDRDSTHRFSSRVNYYIQYRPSYPAEIVHFLQTETGLSTSSVIVDVGSGTGVSAEIFLKHGNRVYGIEPNKEMREAAERLLHTWPNFRSVDGTAESIPLEPHSVDYVVAAQAFHWFDVQRAKAEFQRILKPGGWVVLMWNDRKIDATPFLRAYEEMLRRWSIDYERVRNTNIAPETLRAVFGPEGFDVTVFENFQTFDWDGLKGRALSSSYVPMEGHPNFEAMMVELRRIFDAHQSSGSVRFEYETRVYYGTTD